MNSGELLKGLKNGLMILPQARHFHNSWVPNDFFILFFSSIVHAMYSKFCSLLFQSDYLRRISLKMLTFEAKYQWTAPTAAPSNLKRHRVFP